MLAMTQIHPGVWRLQLGTPEQITPFSAICPTPAVTALTELPAAAAPFAESDISLRLSPRGCTVSLPLQACERIFGFGLQLKSHDQTTLKKTLRTNSDPVADTGDSHAPVPFYLSTAGYAVLVDTSRYATFYCGSHRLEDGTDTVRASATEPLADNAEKLYRQQKSPRGPMVVDIPVAQGVTLYVFGGPSMREALQRYVLFSGGGCLPPMWSLGTWYRGYVNHTQQEAAALARRLRDQHMPFDVYGLEPGWHSHAYACSYRWHPQRFPDPAAFLAEMTELDCRVNLWEHVFVDPEAAIFDALGNCCADTRVWTGRVPDLLHPAARKAFADLHEQAFVSQGVAGFKLDECDNSDFISYPWSFPECAQFPSGVDGEQMHSLLGLLYQQLIYALYRKHDRRTLGQVRSSQALASSLPFVLYSDLYSHRDFIRGVVNAGLSGLLWSPEVRQCASPEDLIRRLQTVVFSPQALINGWMIMNPPWEQVDQEKNNRGELMPDAAEVTAQCRHWLEWRMRLIPYLYAAFATYRERGLPPFRALVADWPDNANTPEIDDAYMMGEDLLVAPVIAGQTARRVYLPPGHWYHLWTEERLAGERFVDVPAPLDQIPVFVREGTILPLARPVQAIRPDTVFELDVRVYGNRCRNTVLLEDDGESFAVERGLCTKVTLAWAPDTGLTVSRTGRWKSERYRLASCRHIG
jgi:alpha-D-xyloside xylohydrolase